MRIARVKDGCPWQTVNAHAGHEFVKSEWRPVPAWDDSVCSWLDYEAEQVATTAETVAEAAGALTEEAPAPAKPAWRARKKSND